MLRRASRLSSRTATAVLNASDAQLTRGARRLVASSTRASTTRFAGTCMYLACLTSAAALVPLGNIRRAHRLDYVCFPCFDCRGVTHV